MKLADIISMGLKQPGKAMLAPTKRVAFKVMGHTSEGERTFLDAGAVLVILDDAEREQAWRAARAAVRARNGGADGTSEEEQEERNYQLLAAAMRDEDDPAAVFARDADALRKALHTLEAGKILDQYAAFLAEEYPEDVDEATWKRMVDDAEKKSLRDLLSLYGSSLIRRALPSLAGRFGAPLTVKSSAGAPTSPPHSG